MRSARPVDCQGLKLTASTTRMLAAPPSKKASRDQLRPPATPSAGIAQLVEQAPCKGEASGSIPDAGTRSPLPRHGAPPANAGAKAGNEMDWPAKAIRAASNEIRGCAMIIVPLDTGASPSRIKYHTDLSPFCTGPGPAGIGFMVPLRACPGVNPGSVQSGFCILDEAFVALPSAAQAKANSSIEVNPSQRPCDQGQTAEFKARARYARTGWRVEPSAVHRLADTGAMGR